MMLLNLLKNYFYSKDFVILQLIYFLSKMNFSAVDGLIAPKIIEVTCVMKNKSEAFRCGHLNKFPALADDIQDDANMYLMAYHTLLNGPAVIMSLVFGSWMDKHGSKLPLVIACSGTITALAFCIIAELLDDFKMEFFLCAAATLGLISKTSVFNIAANSYVSHFVEPQQMISLLTVVTAVSFIGAFTGSFAAGFFQKELTTLPSFVAVEASVIATLVLTCIVIKKHHTEIAMQQLNVTTLSTRESTSDRSSNVVCKSLKAMVDMVFKKQTLTGHLNLAIFVLIPVMNILSNSAFLSILLLFVTKAPLSWTDYMYSFSKGTFFIAMGIMSLVILPFMIDKLKLTDKNILIIGIVAKIMGLVVLGFSKWTWLVYLSIVLYASSCILSIAMKAILSKTGDKRESCKLFALVSALEIFTKAPGNVFALFLYAKTEPIFNGLIFFIEAGIFMPVLIFFYIFFRHTRDDPK